MVKKIFNVIFNNKFFPLNIFRMTFWHRFAIILAVLLYLSVIALEPYEASLETLYNSKKLDIITVSEKNFNERDLNFWVNLKYFIEYEKTLKEKFGYSVAKLPNPKYPAICKLFKSVFGDEILSPINIFEMATIMRKSFGSGLVIRSEDIILEEIEIENWNDLSDEEKLDLLNKYKDRYKKIASIKIKGENFGMDYQKEYLVNYSLPQDSQQDELSKGYPEFSEILNDEYFQNVNLHQIVFYKNKGKILKYKPNSREYVPDSEIPEKIKKAFILNEDDYFYVEPGGIDLPGLVKATYNYFQTGALKGNASIMEQVFEMYIGKQSKSILDKFVQILGAVYYSYYNKDKDKILDLYVQSITGSFRLDHIYGLKSIARNYLNKEDLSKLTNKEIAWASRIALLPTTHGQDYARFHLLKDKFEEFGYDIYNDTDVKKFAEKYGYEAKNVWVGFSGDAQRKIKDFREAYEITEKRIKTALEKFKKGNLFIEPIITEEEYEKALEEEIVFSKPEMINKYQTYTDQTLKDLKKTFGNWALNAGLDVSVALDESAQKVLDEQLYESTRSLWNYRTNFDTDFPRYGGAAVLIKTNDIETGDVINKAVAISSRHPRNPLIEKDYFNWAVNGVRHFGSIYKWLVLLKYLEQGGTLFDEFYDLPRPFEIKDEKGQVTDIYRPDNWKASREDSFGYFTKRKEHNVTNFVKSKNNTFVRIAEIVGLKELAQFFNKLAELENETNEEKRFRPFYSNVLGSMETSSITFAQMMSVVANKGIFKPITTITKIVHSGGVEHKFNLRGERVVSREAAEMAYFVGFLNPFFGTARHFIKGGVAKTGSSDTDVSFIAMTARTDEEIDDGPDELLDNNLLYLVNVGVDSNQVEEGFFGGTIGGSNAKRVFNELLEYNPSTRQRKYSIYGNFLEDYSPKFDFVAGLTPTGNTIYRYNQSMSLLDIKRGEDVLVPKLPGTQITYEKDLTYTEIQDRMEEHILFTEKKITRKLERMLASTANRRKEQEDANSVLYGTYTTPTAGSFDSYFSQLEKEEEELMNYE